MRKTSAVAIALMLYAFHASATDITSANANRMKRFQTQCNDEGLGKACFDYARMLWQQPGANDRGNARKYLLRACELKYKSACQAYHANAFREVPRQPQGGPPAPTRNSACYAKSDERHAKLSMVPNGMHLDKIEPKSFWERAGFQNGDILRQIDQNKVLSVSDASKQLLTSRQQMVFTVGRGGDKITLGYYCH